MQYKKILLFDFILFIYFFAHVVPCLMCYSVNVIFTVKIVTLTTNLQLKTTCQLVTFLILYLITSNYCFYLLNFYSIFITAQRNDSKSGLHMFVIWLIIRTCSWIRSVTVCLYVKKVHSPVKWKQIVYHHEERQSVRWQDSNHQAAAGGLVHIWPCFEKVCGNIIHRSRRNQV